jgi:sugar lactone lactonase YvrE
MTTEAGSLEIVASGFAFAEGPRWHDGAVYVSDIHDDAVKRVSLDGEVTTVAQLPGSPISIGFSSDGTLLVSALSMGCIWAVDHDGKAQVRNDLSSVAPHNFGDIVIDHLGRIYIANQGFDYTQGIPDTIDSPIFLLDTDGSTRQVASGLNYANGLALLPGGGTLIVAETFGHRLVAFDVASDGSLSNERVAVQFDDGARPDGICCDAEGGIWSANAGSHEVVRATLDGSITHRVTTGEHLAIGCILGGSDGGDLFVTTASTPVRDAARLTRNSALWRTRAPAPAGGRP